MKNEQAPAPRRTISRRSFLGGSLAALAAVGGGTAWALDRFVIEHAEVTGASSQWGTTSTTTTSGASTLTANSWTSSAGTITITQRSSGSGSDTITWFEADMRLADATSLRAAFADDTFGQNIIEVPSVIAEQNNAIWAVNGDYYGFRSDGIVIRNGAAFRDAGARQGLAIGRDGTMRLYDETGTSASALIDDGVWHTLSFGPGLVDAGKAISGIDSVEIDTNVGNHSIQGNQPRTGIGMIEANHFVIVVVDGRSNGYSRGMTVPEFADLFVSLGAQVAYNLDGGGSSAMVFDSSLVNNPLGKGSERGTSDILFVAG